MKDHPPDEFPPGTTGSSSRGGWGPPEGDETRTLIPAARRLAPGAVLDGRFRIEKFLGMGGMGRVYLARDLELDQEVALKIIRPELLQDQDATERFKRELILARRVSHRNVVRIHDLGEFEGLKYLTMSYIEGRSLKEILKAEGPLAPDRVEAIFTQICEAVAAAHGEGVIHRDLKPANIMIDGEDRVFVTDFGIARSLDAGDLTMAGAVVGTPAYLSPEQARAGEADARSDIFTLGLILHEMLTGSLPSAGATEIRRTLAGLDAKIPDYLIEAVRKCLAEDPRLRYPAAEALLGDLRARAVAAPLRRPKPWLKWAGAAALVAAAFLYLVWRNGSPTGENPADVDASAAVLVLPFTSPSGDGQSGWLPSAFSDLLISDLGSETRLRVVNGDRVHQTLQDLKLSPGVYDGDVVRRLSQILDAEVVVQGSLTRSGPLLRADAQVLTPSRPGQPTYLQASAGESELFALVDDLASQVKKELRLEPGRKADSHVPALAVLEACQKGTQALREGNYEAAAALLRQAVEADPLYLPAYLKLSEAEEGAGRPEEAAAALKRAFSVDSTDLRTADMIHARHALLEGDLSRSIEIYRRLAERHPNDPDIHFEWALACEEKGDLAAAAAALETVVALDPNHPRAYFHLGKDTILMGQAEKAISDFLLRALGIATQLGNRSDEADALNAIGVAYQRLGRYDEAIRYFNDSITIKEQLGNKRSAGTSLSNIAKIQISRGEYDEAEKILDRNLALFEQAGHQKGVADVYNNFGVLNEDRGRFPAALDYYKRALQLRKQQGDDRLTAQSYDNVGYVYFLLGEYDNAQVYWQQALDLKTAIGEDSGVILSNQNMGFLHMAQGEVEEALQSFLVALDRGRAIKFDNAVAVSLGNLATIYQRQGRYQAALDSYREALALLANLGDKKGLAEYTKLLGSTFLELNAFEEAEESFAQALKLAREIRGAEIVADLEILMSRLHRRRGDLDAAARSLREAARIAEKPGLEKIRTRSVIEQAALRLERGQLGEASALLAQVLGRADAPSNFWLRLDARMVELEIAEKRRDWTSVRKLARETSRLTEGMGLKPVRMELLAAQGRAAQASGETEAAAQSFRQSLTLFREIEKETPERYRPGLGRPAGVETALAAQKTG